VLPSVRVRLVDVPVALFHAAERHTNDLLREVALIAAASTDLGSGHLFGDLLATADAYAHRPAALHRRVADCVALAAAAGHDRVTVDLDADADVVDGAVAWHDLLREFDALSRHEQLLTLPAADDVVAFRSWYVRELVEQVRDGRAPRGWTRARSAVLAGAAG
jgi:hypothetical protein